MDNFSLLDELRECVIEEEAKSLGLMELNDNTQIISVDQANFFLRRLEEIQEEARAINEMCDTEIEKFTERVNKFRNDKISTNVNTQMYFKKLLEKYAESELANSPSKKSIKLPFGTLQFRKGSAQYTYEDETLLKFLKEYKMTNLVSTTIKEAPNKADLKKVADIRDGKLYINDVEIPGVTVAEGTTTFDVKVNS